MYKLFYPTVRAADVPPVPGLGYLPGYVTEADELALIEAIDGMPWNTESRRRRQPYRGGTGVAVLRRRSPTGDAVSPTVCSGRA